MNPPFHAHDAPAHPIPKQKRSRGFIIPLIFVLLIFATALAAAFIFSQKTHSVPITTTYEECVKVPGSMILEIYPPICVTPDKQRFTQELISPLPTQEPSASDPIISEPKNGAYVSSPFTVYGVVPAGWMFEGSFPITLTDNKGYVLRKAIASEVTPGSWSSGEAVPFQAQINFSTTAKTGFLVLEKDNPSGMPENDQTYKIILTFEKATSQGKESEALCKKAGGSYDSTYRECTGVDQTACEQNGGKFNECASACRHNPDPNAACVMMCVTVCEL